MMMENNDKNKRIKMVIIGVCVFWISMFLIGLFAGVNERLEQSVRPAIRHERVVES